VAVFEDGKLVNQKFWAYTERYLKQKKGERI
jgi:hypothetical protein